MNRIGLLIAFLVSALSAQASILFSDGNNSLPGDENIFFNNPSLLLGPAQTIQGITQGGVVFTFTGSENLLGEGGQARVEAEDGNLDSLTVQAENGTFTSLIFNPVFSGVAGTATVTVTPTVGAIQQYVLSVSNGSNFLTITTDGGTRIQSVSVFSGVQLDRFQQFRVGGVDATLNPEPATYTMVGAAFAGLALFSRFRKRPGAAAAAKNA